MNAALAPARDIAILRGLFESRVMTIDHAAALYFDGRRPAAAKRLQKLKKAGLVAERPRHISEPAVHYLTKKAFELLHSDGVLANYPPIGMPSLIKRARVSDSTIKHEIAVMDVKAALSAAIVQTPGLSIVEFATWPLLFDFIPSEIKPDGFIRIAGTDNDGDACEDTFFLEVDRSTHVLESVAKKCADYLAYRKTGRLPEHFGLGRNPEAMPFRVLYVFRPTSVSPAGERRNNVAAELLRLRPQPILEQVWLTTFAEMIANPLGEIWVRPRDYRDVTADTPFAPHLPVQPGPYRRRVEREKLVEERIKKYRLLVD